MKKAQKIALLVQILAIMTSCLFVIGVKAQTQISAKKSWIVNGVDHIDTQGNVINAHGGGLLKVGKFYYLIGENRTNDVLVSCYRSTDLINWEFRGDLLTRQSKSELVNANIECPKVIYNEITGQFVMWMRYDNINDDYSFSHSAVAISTDIEKPFTYLKNFRPLFNLSHDCNLYKDEDGTAYFITSTPENRDMNIYKLTQDYLTIEQKNTILWPNAQREAPAIMKRGAYYFILTSFFTGCEPNQAKYAFSKSMLGPWSDLIDIGSPMTFETQPTYILPIEGEKTTSYLYIADRWNILLSHNSKYIYLPLTFKNDTTMEMEWVNELSPNTVTGELNYVKKSKLDMELNKMNM